MLGVLAAFSSVSTPTSAFVANLPPQWDFSTDEFVINGELRVDLNDAFFDPDYDSLAFSVVAGPGVQAFIEGDVLVVRAVSAGEVKVTASDGKALVTKTLVVRG